MNREEKLIINQSMDDRDTVILALSGDLDIQTAQQLRNFIDKHIQEGNTNIKFDLSKLCYLDSSGYGVLVDASRRTRIKQGKVDLANMPPWMTDFFDMSALER
ncbi:MAG: STAS domain-containing protein [bacterium]|nr:STAS domain-containing protein [bacterium]